MLHIKLNQVVAIEPAIEKPYDFTDDEGKNRKGVTIAATVTGLMTNGKVAIIKVKGKALAEVETKMKALGLVVGKPADIPLVSALTASGVTNANA
jgi:hypothetical protein